MSDLDTRLDALRESGWILTSRRTYTLSRVDRDSSVRSFHSDTLDEELVRRVEAASAPKPPAKLQGQAGPVVDEAMARRLASSNVATGLVSTSTYNK
jgi:hypothetical protein